MSIDGDLITEWWLKNVGFRWHQFDRQPDKHWLLWIRTLQDPDELGIEVAPGAYMGIGQADGWFCWFRSDCSGRYHRFIHVRHLTTRASLIKLVEAISGQAWDPANHWHGAVVTPDMAERCRREINRADQRNLRSRSPWHGVERDSHRGRPLFEHMQAAVDSGKAK